MFDSELNHWRGQFRVLTWTELASQCEPTEWLNRYFEDKF